MKKYILNPISLFVIGAILGVVSKCLDIYTTGNIFMMALGDMFSGFSVWVLFGVLISVYSDTKKKAMLNIFPFCIGMLITYYLMAELLDAVYGWIFIKGWILFSLFSPLFACLTWQTKEKGIFPKIISIGIILVTIIGDFILQRTFIIPDFIIIPLIAYILFLKKIKRSKSEYKKK